MLQDEQSMESDCLAALDQSCFLYLWSSLQDCWSIFADDVKMYLVTMSQKLVGAVA